VTATAGFDAALAFARDLIRIPSLSGEEGAVATRVLSEMKALGFDDVRADRLGNVIGVLRGTGDGPTVMLNSHLDVVGEGEASEWEHPPFSGDVAGGFLHGRGAMDIKGPLAIQTHAAARLRGRTPGDIVVAHTVMEERGGWGMVSLLDEEEVRPDVVILGEATAGEICVGHRGRAEVRIVVHGVAGHASAPERARNALDLLPAILEAVDGLAARQGSDPELGPATIVATDVETSPASHNVIPDRTVVTLDWRVLPGPTVAELIREVEAAVAERLPEPGTGYRVQVAMAVERQRSYTGVTEDRDMFTPGYLLDQDHPVVLAARLAVGRRDGDGPASVRPWTFATDGGWSCGLYGVPTIGFAPGEESFAHTNRERLDLSEAEWAFGRYPDLVLAVMEGAA
jgi:succinyl-diaminopimelate desuccinylase